MRFEFHHGFACWSLRRHADVRAALRDPRRFATSPTPGFDEDGHTRVLRRAVDGIDAAAWRVELEALPVDGGARDLVADFAEPWCHAAALRLCGARGGALLALARAAYAAGAAPMDGSLREPAEAASRELASLLPEGPLTVQAFVATSQTLAAFLGNAMVALLEARAFGGRGLERGLEHGLEELFRFAGPAQAQFRYAAADLGEVPRGSRIALLLAEANRDPERFSDPDTLDFGRDATGHLAFGGGAHACAGAALIRLAAPVALRRFAELYANAELASVEWPADVRAIRSPLRVRIRELAPGRFRSDD